MHAFVLYAGPALFGSGKMPHNRFYCPEDLKKEKKLSLSSEEAKHAQVFRLQKGDLCEVVNGKGTLGKAKILALEKRECKVQILSTEEKIKTSSFFLIVGNLKPTKLDLIVRMATEIGVDHFFFFDAFFSEKKGLSISQTSRLRQIAISALKQSGGFFLPQISYCTSLEKVPIFPGYSYFYADPFSCPKVTVKPQNIACIIGPEKGFSQKERSYLDEKLKAISLLLSPKVLRTETAAVVIAYFFCGYTLDGK